jgi:5-methylcytosine-specific restriction endonuclease McrA
MASRVSAQRRLAVLTRDGWQCMMPECLHPAEAGGRAIDRDLPRADKWAATVDHVEQRSDGGRSGPLNLRAAHRECNEASARARLVPAAHRECNAVREWDPETRAALNSGDWRRKMGVYDRLRQAERDGMSPRALGSAV